MTTQATKTSGELAFFAIALLVVLALVGGFLLLGVPGIAMVMVGVTPVAYLILVILSVGG